MRGSHDRGAFGRGKGRQHVEQLGRIWEQQRLVEQRFQ
jgi:hypothetical protein